MFIVRSKQKVILVSKQAQADAVPVVRGKFARVGEFLIH